MTTPFKEDKKATHRIVIEHPFINQVLGLRTITVNQLIEWWNYQERGRYVNRQWFTKVRVTIDEDDQEIEETIQASLSDILSLESWSYLDDLEGEYPCTLADGEFTTGTTVTITPEEKEEFFIFRPWRNPSESEAGGKYTQFFIPEIHTDNPFSIYEQWTFSDYDVITKLLIKGPYGHEDLEVDNLRSGELIGDIGDPDAVIVYSQFVQAINIIEDQQEDTVRWFGDLIIMNEFANEALAKFVWDEIELDTEERHNAARLELCRDIRTSKQGYITWAGNVQFNIKNDMMDCTKTEVVKYSLYLDSYQGVEETTLKAAIRIPMIAQTPTDVAGRATLAGKDGEHTAVDPKDISKTIAAPIDFKYNPALNKFESGNEQTPAILLTNIAAATRDGDILQVLEEITPEDIANGIYPQYISWGDAVPLQIMNSNPHIWSAPLLHDESKRKCLEDDDAKRKVSLKVANIFPRTWASGQSVMLSRFHNVWIPMDPGREEEPPEPPVIFRGKWDFSYFLTNAEFYFRNKKHEGITWSSTQFFYEEYEMKFRNNFYEQWNSIKPFNSGVLSTLVDPAYGGYAQITSWDFMGSHMGGTRNDTGNAIAATVYGKTTWGQDYENKDVGLDGYYEAGISNPFFGCVFPDGYDSEEVDQKKALFLGATDAISTQEGLTYQLIKTPDEDKKIVDDKNINAEDGIYEIGDGGPEKGAFASSLFTHVPADIAVNSSLLGTSGDGIFTQYGSPITDIRYVNSKFAGDGLVTSEAYFQEPRRHAYLYYNAGSDEVPIYNPVFNLKPNNHNIIQFRPLKIDTYSAGEYVGLKTNNLLKATAMDQPEYRGQFSRQAADTVKSPYGFDQSSVPPTWSPEVIQRHDEIFATSLNSLRITRPIQSHEVRDDWNSSPGGPIPPNPIDLGFAYGYEDFEYDGRTGNLTPGQFPERPWDRTQWNNNPAGAIGIIGTICTVQTTNSFTITTRNSYGLRNIVTLGSYGGGTIVTTIGTILTDVTQIGGFRPGDTTYSWGSSDRYYDFNTLMLYARVFEAWPRELTLYDPRFFSVFHFNYGAGHLADDVPSVIYVEWSIPDPVPDLDPEDQDYANGTFIHYPKVYDGDLQTITTFEGEYLYAGTDFKVLRMNESIYGGVFLTNSTEPEFQIRKKEHWNVVVDNDPINDGRTPRGKLLPYRYQRDVLTIGAKNDVIQGNSDNYYVAEAVENDTPDLTALEVPAGSVLAVNVGTGYRVGDTFTVSSNRNISLRIPTNGVDGQGRVLSLQIVNPGDDFEASDFMTPDRVLNRQATSNAKILPVSTAGGSRFIAYFVSGKISIVDKTVEKPGEVTDLLQLTPTSKEATDRSVVKTSRTQLVQIDQDEKHYETTEYDIFCHFHNDASFVFGAQHPENPVTHEQYVEMEIVAI